MNYGPGGRAPTAPTARKDRSDEMIVILETIGCMFSLRRYRSYVVKMYRRMTSCLTENAKADMTQSMRFITIG